MVLHVSCWTRTSGGHFRPSEVRFWGTLALLSDWFFNVRTQETFYLFRSYGPDFKINIFWILISNPDLWLKQNLCWTWTNVPIILEIAFRWLSFFWFLSSSSRTRARSVWSKGDNDMTDHHHHRQCHQLQTALALVLDELERNQK